MNPGDTAPSSGGAETQQRTYIGRVVAMFRPVASDNNNNNNSGFI